MKKESFPTGSNWKRILNEIYNHAPHSWCESSKCERNDDNHPIAKNLKITGQELMLGISFLETHNLIKTIGTNKQLNSINNLHLLNPIIPVTLEELTSSLGEDAVISQALAANQKQIAKIKNPEQRKEALKLLDINVLDHVIVTKDSYTSLTDEGLI